MALKKTVTTQHGLVAEDAYHKVDTVTIVNKNQIDFVLKSFAAVDKSAFAEVLYSASYNIEGENPIKQAYIQLKKQADFANAIDC
jgi:hypothetical protein